MRTSLLILILLVFSLSAEAKLPESLFKAEKDTNYIESYFNDLIIRIYSGEKTHSLELNDLNTPYRLTYQPNGYYNLGAGFNFRSFGLSLATKIPVFQNDNLNHGITKRIGIQSYIYLSKFTVDLLASFHKGYYLNNSYTHLPSYSNGKEYQRPDISSANVGITVNYIFNHSRFSYRAAFNDTERQKKSAGSLIAGASIYSYQTKADSAFVPREINPDYFLKSRRLEKLGVFAMNANLGYAYSLVFLKNGIFTLSYILGSGIQDNLFRGDTDNEINRLRFSIKHTGRIGIGYRINQYYARLGMIHSTQFTNLKYNDLGIANGTGFVQLSLGKRFSLRK